MSQFGLMRIAGDHQEEKNLNSYLPGCFMWISSVPGSQVNSCMSSVSFFFPKKGGKMQSNLIKHILKTLYLDCQIIILPYSTHFSFYILGGFLISAWPLCKPLSNI